LLQEVAEEQQTGDQELEQADTGLLLLAKILAVEHLLNPDQRFQPEHRIQS
jgi:hypothetical protein